MAAHGIIATLITNGYLLTPQRIRRLNLAGLDYLQISVDNVVPDQVSKKSLKVLEQKLVWLAEHAEFSVTVNSVLGYSMPHPEDALVVALRALAQGPLKTAAPVRLLSRLFLTSKRRPAWAGLALRILRVR